jgi:hypothetical protein
VGLIIGMMWWRGIETGGRWDKVYAGKREGRIDGAKKKKTHKEGGKLREGRTSQGRRIAVLEKYFR